MGGAETMGTQARRPLPDARRASPGVAVGTSGRRGGKRVRSRTDYILGSDCQIFQNVAIREPRHNYDHYMVLWYIRGASPR